MLYSPSVTPLLPLVKRLEAGQRTHLLAFGSSNTQRRIPGMHWFDCIDLAIAQNFGPIHRCLNAGIGGDTSRGLLGRFDADASAFQPHAAFVTIGGNDCHPDNDISSEEFETNLYEIHRRFRALGTLVIFQTYYAPDSDGSERFIQLHKYSDIVRRVASETGSALIDHLARWEPFRSQNPTAYAPLMLDALHVNHRGNMVMGVDIIRAFGLPLATDLGFWGEALFIQHLMDLVTADTTSAK